MKGKKRESARGWGYCLRLMTVYGLRPIETRNLELRKQNGKTKVWCTYCKRSVGLGKPRELFAIHEELEEKWNLRQRIKNGEKLPEAKDGVGEGLKNYFKSNDFWTKLKEEDPFFGRITEKASSATRYPVFPEAPVIANFIRFLIK